MKKFGIIFLTFLSLIAILGYLLFKSQFANYAIAEIYYTLGDYKKSGTFFEYGAKQTKDTTELKEKFLLGKGASFAAVSDFTGALQTLGSFESKNDEIEAERLFRAGNAIFHTSENEKPVIKELLLSFALKSYRQSLGHKKDARVEFNIQFIENLLKEKKQESKEKESKNKTQSEDSGNESGSGSEQKDSKSGSGSASGQKDTEKLGKDSTGSQNSSSGQTESGSGKVQGIPSSRGTSFTEGVDMTGSLQTPLTPGEKAQIEALRERINKDQSEKSTKTRLDGKKQGSSSKVPDVFRGIMKGDPIFGKFFSEGKEDTKDW